MKARVGMVQNLPQRLLELAETCGDDDLAVSLRLCSQAADSLLKANAAQVRTICDLQGKVVDMKMTIEVLEDNAMERAEYS